MKQIGKTTTRKFRILSKKNLGPVLLLHLVAYANLQPIVRSIVLLFTILLCIDLNAQDNMYIPCNVGGYKFRFDPEKYEAAMGGILNTQYTEIEVPDYIDLTDSNGRKYNCKIVKIFGFSNMPTLHKVKLSKDVRVIAYNTFEGCTNLTTVQIPSGSHLETIEYMAFYGCNQLTSFDIPSTVNEIGNAAFAGCSNLYNITLPNLTAIRASSFSGCTGLSSITIPNSVTSIEPMAFSGTGLTNIIIPSNVTSIGANAFDGCTELKSATIGEGTGEMTIGANAFINCTKLHSVKLGNCVTKIGNQAFADLESLSSVEMSSGLSDIGYSAFSGCKSISSLDIPECVTSIGEMAFSGCIGLQTLKVGIGEGNMTIGTKAFTGCSNVASIDIGRSVKQIGESAFEGCTELHTLNLGKELKVITKNAFNGCKKLTSLTVPNNITEIQLSAFSGCQSLASLTIEGGNIVIGEKAFYDCNNLNNLSLGNGVASIGKQAFANCSSLQSLTIPNSVTTIDKEAFAGSEALTYLKIGEGKGNMIIGQQVFGNEQNIIETLIIGNSVTTTYNNSFGSFTKLKYLTLGTGLGWINNMFHCSELETLTIGVGDKGNVNVTIREDAFKNCEKLESVTIGDAVTEIGSGAFYNCHKIKTLTLGENISEIGGGAFEINTNNDSQLTTLSIPGIKEIGNRAFAGQRHLTLLTIAEGVETIGNQAFIDCNSLAGVEIPNRVTSIGDKAFMKGSTNTDNNGNENHAVKIAGSVKTIGNEAFSGWSDMTSLTIQEGVEQIGKSAFLGCSSLLSLSIPSTVSSVGEKAFYNCTSLKTLNVDCDIVPYQCFYDCKELVNLTIGSNVSQISEEAFAECVKLETITITNGLTQIGRKAFFGCNDLKSLALPRSLTSIGTEAFYGCQSMTTLQLSTSLQEIPYRAFYNCEKLEKVEAPTSITTIGEEAFWECNSVSTIKLPGVANIEKNAFLHATSLETLEFGESLKSIGNNAFEGCGVTNVTIANAESLGAWAFADCPNLETLSILKGTISGGCFNNCPKLLNVTLGEGVEIKENAKNPFAECNAIENLSLDIATVTNLFKGHESIKTLSIGAHVSQINQEAFDGCNKLETITFDDGISQIGANAFHGCSSLKALALPSSLIAIGKNAFSGCSNMKNLKLSESMTEIPQGAFYQCTSLEDLGVPVGITDIGEQAFYGCSFLRSIKLPGVVNIVQNAFGNATSLDTLEFGDNLKKVGQYAFSGCTSLKRLVISTNTESLGREAFSGCTGLETLSLLGGTISTYCFKNCSNLRNLTIGEGVQGIGTSTFTGCKAIETLSLNLTTIPDKLFSSTNITSLTLGNNVQKIGTSSFSNCKNLETITIGNSISEIGANAFSGCIKIGSIRIPGSVTAIGNSAFAGCSLLSDVEIESGEASVTIGSSAFTGIGLTTIQIPSNVISIGDCAFQGCSNLQSVTVESGMIMNEAFNQCSNLLSVEIGDGVTSIGNYAFTNTSLESLTLGEGLRQIGRSTFYNTKIKELQIPFSVEQIGEFAFSNCYSLENMTIHSGIVSNYAFGNCTGLQTLLIDKGVSKIGNNAFNNCNNLAELTIENGVETIGSNAFNGCGTLQELTIPHSVTSIGENAFKGCTNLETLSLSNSLTEIANGVFENCNSLQELTIPKRVKKIGRDSFKNCFKLSGTLVIPSDVTEIGNNAFCNGYLIENLEIGEKVTTIGDCAFISCKGIQSLSLPESIISLGASAFHSCSGMKSLEVPCGTIGQACFYGCSGLETVIIGGCESEVSASRQVGAEQRSLNNNINATSIGENAFYYCSNLKILNLMENVSAIGDNAFFNTKKLESIYCDVSEPISINKNVFNSPTGFNSAPDLYVPGGSEEKYRNDPVWGLLYNLKSQLRVYAYEGFEGKKTVTNEHIKGLTADGESTITLALNEEVEGNIQNLELTKTTIFKLNYLGNVQTSETLTNYPFRNITDENEMCLIDEDGMTFEEGSGISIRPIWGFNLEAPADFPADYDGNEYEVELKAVFTDENGRKYEASKRIRILRPGVLLLHGWHSESGRMKGIEEYLITHGYYRSQILNYDYNKTATATLEANAEVVKNGMSSIYHRLLRDEGIVSHRYDIVAHSMGGLVARVYAQKCNKPKKDGGLELAVNPVNRIITINTPHSGTQFATLAAEKIVPFVNSYMEGGMVSMGPVAYPIKEVMDYVFNIRDEINNIINDSGTGAMDMIPSSKAMKLLNSEDNLKYESSIPCHAICSYFDYNYFWDAEFQYARAYMLWPPLACVYLGALLLWGDDLIDTDQKLLQWIYKDGTGHDGMVPFKSQRGGLSGPCITSSHEEYNCFFGMFNNAHHNWINTAEKTFSDILVLLKQPMSSPSFRGGFHPEPIEDLQFGNATSSRRLSCKKNALDEQFLYLSLEKVDTTRTLKVSINKNPEVKRVWCYTKIDDQNMISTFAKDSICFEIPETYGGLLVVNAIGITKDQDIVFAVDTVSYDYAARLTYMEYESHDEVTVRVGEPVDFKVYGGWSNGEEIYVNPEMTTNTLGLLRIDGQKVVGAKPGSCMLYASLLGKVDSIRVNVYAINELAVRDTSVYKGTKVVLPISLQNDCDATALQMDVELPEGFTLKETTLSERKENHTVEVKLQESGAYTILISSPNSAAFKGNDSILVNLTIDIPESIINGEYTLYIKKVKMTTTDADTLQLNNGTMKVKVTIPVIDFADAEVKRICVENWDFDGDGELSYKEAAAVTDIDMAFRENKLITTFDELKYFTGITSLYPYQFYRCNALESIFIPKNASVVGNPFTYCTSLRNIVVDKENTKVASRNGCNAIITNADNVLRVGCKSSIIPEGVVEISGDAFAGCSELTELTLPKSLRTINYWAFNYCSGLTSLFIPKGVTSIYNGTSFANCSGLTSIVVDDENTVYDSRNDCNAIIESASNKLIAGCENTIIPEDVVEINNYAFSARPVTDIVIPGNVKTINLSAFSNCKDLAALTIEEGVETIGQFAFSECTSLTSVRLPSSITSIGNCAFQTHSLTSVTVDRREPVAISSNNTFSNRTNATLYVPKGCKDAYENAPYWQDFKEIVELVDKGDVNGDRKVNITDTTILKDYILDKKPAGFVINAADMDGNGVVNITDLTLLKDKILGK